MQIIHRSGQLGCVLVFLQDAVCMKGGGFFFFFTLKVLLGVYFLPIYNAGADVFKCKK